MSSGGTGRASGQRIAPAYQRAKACTQPNSCAVERLHRARRCSASNCSAMGLPASSTSVSTRSASTFGSPTSTILGDPRAVRLSGATRSVVLRSRSCVSASLRLEWQSCRRTCVHQLGGYLPRRLSCGIFGSGCPRLRQLSAYQLAIWSMTLDSASPNKTDTRVSLLPLGLRRSCLVSQLRVRPSDHSPHQSACSTRREVCSRIDHPRETPWVTGACHQGSSVAEVVEVPAVRTRQRARCPSCHQPSCRQSMAANSSMQSHGPYPAAHGTFGTRPHRGPARP